MRPRTVDPCKAVFAAILYAMARKQPGATVSEMCAKLNELHDLKDTKECLSQCGLERVAGGWYSEFLDQIIGSHLMSGNATKDDKTGRIVLTTSGIDECATIARSCLHDHPDHFYFLHVLKYLGIHINPALPRLVKRRDIYSDLSNDQIMVFIEYADPADTRDGERIYHDLGFEHAGIDFGPESASAMLAGAEFIAIKFWTEDEARERINALAMGDNRQRYRAFMYVNGEPVHENI